MSKEVKQIRGQVRQIVKELLPELLTTELVNSMHRELLEIITKRLQAVDDTQKDIIGYMCRQNAPAMIPMPDKASE